MGKLSSYWKENPKETIKNGLASLWVTSHTDDENLIEWFWSIEFEKTPTITDDKDLVDWDIWSNEDDFLDDDEVFYGWDWEKIDFA